MQAMTATTGSGREAREAGEQVRAYELAVNPVRVAAYRESTGVRVFTRAHGSTLVDSTGREYLDLVCSFGAATLGHRHPAVMEALEEAIRGDVPFAAAFGIPARAGELACRLSEIAGRGLSKVYFCNTGAEAIETSLKLAAAVTGRAEFVAIEGCFHGLTTGALSLAGAEYWREPFRALPGLAVQRVPFGDVQRIADLLRTERFAAVVLEVVQGMAGVRRWSDAALAEVAELCRRHGTLLIADEVLTGIGRTGRWFAFQTSNVRPDVVVCSKGLSGGVFPVATVLMQEDVYRAVYTQLSRANVHSNTFEANLGALTVASAVLRVIEREQLLARVQQTGEYLARGLLAISTEGLGLSEVRSHGLLAAFKVQGLDDPDDVFGGVLCSRELLENSVITCSANHDARFVKLTPAFNVGLGALDDFFVRLRQVLSWLGEQRVP